MKLLLHSLAFYGYAKIDAQKKAAQLNELIKKPAIIDGKS